MKQESPAFRYGECQFEIEVFSDKYTTMFAERNGDKEYNHFEFGDGKVMDR